jgi:hypothetical protein
VHRSLNNLENLRMGELQMDWLRSEDLKEEKVITTSFAIIAVRENSLDPYWPVLQTPPGLVKS